MIVKVAGTAVGQLTGSGTAWDLARTIEAEKYGLIAKEIGKVTK